MYAVVLGIHLLICFALVGVVLMQSGKGGGLAGGAFGGGAQTVFGGRGANDFITRATMVLGAAFFVTSLSLALMSSSGPRASRSLMQEEARKAGAPGVGRAPTQQAPGGATLPAPTQPAAPTGGSKPPGGH